MRSWMRPRQIVRWLAGVAVAALGIVPSHGAERPDALLTQANPRVLEVIAVQEEATPDLMAYEEILGTAVGPGADGQVGLLVYVDQDHPGMAGIVRALPPSLRGVAVTAVKTDKFYALGPVRPGKKPDRPGKPGDGEDISHTAIQEPPIRLGTSGGWSYDLANGYCCGGTLGSLIGIGGVGYILSNYHVFEGDTVPGGNNLVATDGDPVVQPGLIDVGCNASSAQEVAMLVVSASLPNSNVDASIAQVVPGMVSAEILEIGAISSQTVEAAIRQRVKKSGRTTGLTRSSVTGLNGTVRVVYENECAGGFAFEKTFTGQIVISNRGSRFLAAGDSGSLMVEDVDTSPRAVGLLFAGSSQLAVANPIDEVLTFFGATMVGQ